MVLTHRSVPPNDIAFSGKRSESAATKGSVDLLLVLGGGGYATRRWQWLGAGGLIKIGLCSHFAGMNFSAVPFMQ
jgi:hypothetical protein